MFGFEILATAFIETDNFSRGVFGLNLAFSWGSFVSFSHNGTPDGWFMTAKVVCHGVIEDINV